MAVARGATSLSSSDQATTDNQLSLLSGFNQYTRNYAQFCALPPKDRFFYHLSGDRIVEEKLDNDSWKPNGGDPPRIPLPSSWWDNVPLQSPIPNRVSNLGPKDIRFTRNKANTVIYAIVLGWPRETFIVQSLGISAATAPGRIARVELLGTGDRVSWSQNADGLRVQLLKDYQPKVDYAAALRVTVS